MSAAISLAMEGPRNGWDVLGGLVFWSAVVAIVYLTTRK